MLLKYFLNMTGIGPVPVLDSPFPSHSVKVGRELWRSSSPTLCKQGYLDCWASCLVLLKADTEKKKKALNVPLFSTFLLVIWPYTSIQCFLQTSDHCWRIWKIFLCCLTPYYLVLAQVELWLLFFFLHKNVNCNSLFSWWSQDLSSRDHRCSFFTLVPRVLSKGDCLPCLFDLPFS